MTRIYRFVNDTGFEALVLAASDAAAIREIDQKMGVPPNLRLTHVYDVGMTPLIIYAAKEF